MGNPQTNLQPLLTHNEQHDHPYLHNFHTHIPSYIESSADPQQFLQSIGNTGREPFGFSNPRIGGNIEVPYLDKNENHQHQYRLKVTAKPVNVPENNGRLSYVMTSRNPNMPNEPPQKFIPQSNSEIIAHVVPSVSERELVCVKPLHFAHVNEYYNSCENKNVSERNQGSNENDMEKLSEENQRQEFDNASQQRAFVSRPLTDDKEMLEKLSTEKPKIYNWIAPSTLKPHQDEEEEERESLKGDLQDSKPTFDSLPSHAFSRVFSQSSKKFDHQLAEHEQNPTINDTLSPHIISTPLDDELGLPNELRPSIVYGGIEHAPPEFMGRKEPLEYKLHAIEIHQYIAIPGKEDPWIIKNKLDPARTAIFGPIPLPFDPVQTGMVAPTFQKTRHNEPVPVLSFEISRMFNEEICPVPGSRDDLNKFLTVE